jgi:tryptophanyl-tRNA synthetase
MQMKTDPARKLRSDPGNPDICNVYTMHKIYSKPDEIEMVNHECRIAGIGCVECKKLFAKNLNENLAEFRAKRAEIAKDTDKVYEILVEGGKRARKIANVTMQEVREAVGLP